MRLDPAEMPPLEREVIEKGGLLGVASEYGGEHHGGSSLKLCNPKATQLSGRITHQITHARHKRTRAATRCLLLANRARRRRSLPAGLLDLSRARGRTDRRSEPVASTEGWLVRARGACGFRYGYDRRRQPGGRMDLMDRSGEASEGVRGKKDMMA